ncbi:LysM peptidoglycan-binding domain-containing protein [Streptomyces sp. NPDC001502]|uniref:LysM peptidoglycan-binding domain-containing protein n=1 Tax=Streptomyces sp. NPDC001502 TaxID=3364578 RepID=UPI0036A1917F
MSPTPLRTAGRLLRALVGLVVLAALVAGIPVVLLAIGHQPTRLTGGLDLLTQQDDGQFFLTVLTCIGWAAWAAFTLSAAMEAIALLRGRKARRIKGLGGLQSLAGLLLGGIVLLAPTAASAATTGPAVTATALQTAHTADSQAPTPDSAVTPKETWPTHTVTSTSELPWDLAEEYLGKGQRWKDIAALNPDISQLVAGDQFLPKGAVIRLPADARLAPPAAAPTTAPPPSDASPPVQRTGTGNDGTAGTPAAPDQPEHVTVRPGDSLWSIADAHGDPEDWPEIFEANRGEALPGGGNFDDPDLIIPGQELDLPRARVPHPSPPATPEKPAGKPADPAPVPAPPTVPGPVAPAPSTTPSAPAASHRTPSGVEQVPETDQALAPAAVWAGAGALAAALVGTLATRRILQQRRRRPGRRIPMPEGRAAATEQGLRAAQHPSGFELLDVALRSLALNLAAVHRELPIVTAVVLHESKVELHLEGDSVPVKPFTGAAGRTDLWTCSASSPDLAGQEALQGAEAPYPALVSLGWDSAGHLVLVDLEHVGTLHLDGDPDHARHVLQAVAVELASTPLPGHLEITALAGTAPGLDAAAPERVVRIQETEEATAELTGHIEDQRRALAAIGASGMRTARLLDDAGGAWTPHILLAQDLPDDADVEALLTALATEPRVAGAVITSSTRLRSPSGGWSLNCQSRNETVLLPGSRLPVKLQGLSDQHFADAIELLTLAAGDADAQAPEWLDAVLGENGSTEGQADGERTDGPAEAVTFEDVVNAGGEPEAAEDPASDGDPAPPAVDMAKIAPQPPVEPEPAAGPTLADLFAEVGAGPLRAADHPEPVPARPAPEAAATRTSSADLPGGPWSVDASLAPTLPLPPGTVGLAPEPVATAPRVLLLGPVGITGATGRIDSNRLKIGTELVAYLALAPGVDHHAIDDALWPGRRVNKEMRNATISRTRSWLGKDTDGKAHLPRVQDTGDNRYRLGPAVTSDWAAFQGYARTGLAHHDEDGDLALRRALTLVRGRPFAAIDPQRYAWAEPAIQEMVSAVADIAYELSTRRREAGDPPGALWAAHQGLLAAEENELLHRQVFLAHHAAGDFAALREAAARLVRINEQLGGGVDMEFETAQLLRTLLPQTPVRR